MQEFPVFYLRSKMMKYVFGLEHGILMDQSPTQSWWKVKMNVCVFNHVPPRPFLYQPRCCCRSHKKACLIEDNTKRTTVSFGVRLRPNSSTLLCSGQTPSGTGTTFRIDTTDRTGLDRRFRKTIEVRSFLPSLAVNLEPRFFHHLPYPYSARGTRHEPHPPPDRAPKHQPLAHVSRPLNY